MFTTKKARAKMGRAYPELITLPQASNQRSIVPVQRY
jgi:hypothetical protein